jgi:hypothetical protein
MKNRKSTITYLCRHGKPTEIKERQAARPDIIKA